MADAIATFLLENLIQVLEKEKLLPSGVHSLESQLKITLSFLRDTEGVPKELLVQTRDVAYAAEDVIDEYVFWAYAERNKNWLRFLHNLARKHNILKRINYIVKQTEEIQRNIIQKKVAQTAGGNASTRHGKRAPIVDYADTVGFTNEVKTLVKRLIRGELKLTAISIVGMGGLGKTILAKKVYNHFLTIYEFMHRAWVYVSQENTPEGIMFSILECLTQVTEEMKEMDIKSLGDTLHGQLQGKKYLVVMDDFWKPQVWEDLRPFFPDNNNGSRIMFTTRIVEVATCAGSDQKNPPHYPRLLSEEESWKLFQNKALPGETCPPQWKKRGKRIAVKCGGLPLAIVVLGGLLSLKQGTFDEWVRVDNQVSKFLSGHPAEFKEILALSYKELPYYLKPCFLYLGIFPEDYHISAKQLIHLWVAEGFIRVNPGESMEDTAERYLEMLVSRSLVQVMTRGSSGGMKTCCIHRFIRDICISESQLENFLQVDVFADSSPRRFTGNNEAITSIIKNPSAVKQLRTLLCFTDDADNLQGWGQLLKAMRLLKVYKVSSGVVPKEVRNLLFLKYFSLGENSDLKVPSSVSYLLNLQVFDARSKSLSFEPAGIWKLKKLRHVYFQGSMLLPQPISNSLLTDLQTLSTISPMSCTPEVFQMVPNLLKLGVKGDLNALPAENLKKLKKLRKLKLVRTDEFLGLISFPLEMLSKLTELTLCNTQLEVDPMVLLGSLENVQTLKLSNNVYPCIHMICLPNKFPQLKHLKLVSLECTRQVLMVKSAMPKLECFIVDDCRSLECLTGVQFLTKLQVLDLQKPTAKLRHKMQELNKNSQQFQLQIYPPQENHKG